MRKLTSVFTFLLSTTFSMPATYPNKRPTKIGTSELAKRSIIGWLVLEPLCFEPAANEQRGLSHLEGSLRFESIAKIDRAAACVCNGSDQFVLYHANILLRRLLWIFNMKKFVEETELCIIPNVVGHRGNLLRELLKFLYGAARNPRGRGFVHGMDRDAV